MEVRTEPNHEAATAERDLPPEQFVDSKGRRWSLAIDYGRALAIRDSELAVDLLDTTDGGIFRRIATEPLVLFPLLWALVRGGHQTEAEKSDEDRQAERDFYGGLDGPAIDRATVALEGAIVGFTPRAIRPRTEATLAKVKQVIDQAAAAEVELIDSAEFDAAINLVIGQAKQTIRQQATAALSAPGEPDTSSPERSASSRGDTPFAN